MVPATEKRDPPGGGGEVKNGAYELQTATQLSRDLRQVPVPPHTPKLKEDVE